MNLNWIPDIDLEQLEAVLSLIAYGCALGIAIILLSCVHTLHHYRKEIRRRFRKPTESERRINRDRL